MRADERGSALARMLPRVPVRHWTVSLPLELRGLVAADDLVLSRVSRLFIREIFDHYLDAVAKATGVPRDRLRCGAASLTHRVGTALNLDTHLHGLFLDGAYAVDGDQVTFHPLTDPPDAATVRRIAGRVRRLLSTALGPPVPRRQPSPEQREIEGLREAAVRHRDVAGPRAHPGVRRVVVEPPPGDAGRPRPRQRVAPVAAAVAPPGSVRADHGGVRVFAGAPVEPTDRRSVLRLSRYVTRPAVDPRAFESRPDGVIRYRLAHPFADGTTHVDFSPDELARRLRALTQGGAANRVSYHGVLAPRAADRWRVVPTQLVLVEDDAEGTASRDAHRSRPAKRAPTGTRRGVDPAPDPFRCDQCARPMRVVAVEEQAHRALESAVGEPGPTPSGANGR